MAMKPKLPPTTGSGDLHADAAVSKRKRERKLNLVSIAKQAAKAGLEVSRYEVDPGGKIIVVTGKTEPEQKNDLDQWMTRRHAN